MHVWVCLCNEETTYGSSTVLYIVLCYQKVCNIVRMSGSHSVMPRASVHSSSACVCVYISVGGVLISCHSPQHVASCACTRSEDMMILSQLYAVHANV